MVALRADLDALPIQDDTTGSYRSVNPGVAHPVFEGGEFRRGTNVPVNGRRGVYGFDVPERLDKKLVTGVVIQILPKSSRFDTRSRTMVYVLSPLPPTCGKQPSRRNL